MSMIVHFSDTVFAPLCHNLKMDVKPRARPSPGKQSDASCQHVIALDHNPEEERVPLWTSADGWRDACDGVQTRLEAVALCLAADMAVPRLSSLHLSGVRLAHYFGVIFLND